MEIKNLKDTPLSEIVTCISASFADYFVQLPTEVDYWEHRFKGARVDLTFSYGCFDQGKLIGFIINGIDKLDNHLVAFNTGTGVTQESRGKQIIDKLYAFALPHLKENGISLCMLEVIEQNEVAQHVYERIGFSKSRKLLCFQGKIEIPEPFRQAQVQPSDIDAIEEEITKRDHHYSWESNLNAIKEQKSSYQYWTVAGKDNRNIGYFIINSNKKVLIQAEAISDKLEDWLVLLHGISSICPSIKINNVQENRTAFISALQQADLENYINQYEMEMKVV